MRNEFEMLNRLNNNEDFEEETLTEKEKNEIFNRVKGKLPKKKKENKKFIVAVCLSCAVVGSILLTNENVLASINKVGRSIESFFNKEEGVLKPYKDKVIVETEDKGIKLIVNEVAFDNSEILVSATIDYNNFKNEDYGISTERDAKIIPREMVRFTVAQNGEKAPLSGSSGTFEYNENKTVDMLLSVKLDESEAKGIYAVNITVEGMDAQLSDNVINIKGSWSVDFEVDGDKMKADTKSYTINKQTELKFKENSMNVNIKEVRVSPLTMVMEYSYSNIIDDEGVIFKFEDENGKEINFISGGGSPERMTYKYNIDREIKSIKIIPGKATYNRFFTTEKFFEDQAIIVNLD